MLVLTAFFSVFLFAETGYKGIEWICTEAECSKQVELKLQFENNSVGDRLVKEFMSDISEKINETVILGKQTTVGYMFVPIDNEYFLFGISYVVNTNQIKKLQNKFKKIRQYKTLQQVVGVKEFYAQDELNNLGLTPNDITPEIEDSLIRYMFCQSSLGYILSGEEFDTFSWIGLEPPTKKNKKATGTLTIYDYNDDTRVYIYDNIIKDKAVVVYVPHEQDY